LLYLTHLLLLCPPGPFFPSIRHDGSLYGKKQ
jgi:hypothetical protein